MEISLVLGFGYHLVLFERFYELLDRSLKRGFLRVSPQRSLVLLSMNSFNSGNSIGKSSLLLLFGILLFLRTYRSGPEVPCFWLHLRNFFLLFFFLDPLNGFSCLKKLIVRTFLFLSLAFNYELLLELIEGFFILSFIFHLRPICEL